MIGSADIGTCLRENGEFDESAGITPRAVSEIFRLLNERHAQITYEVEVGLFPILNYLCQMKLYDCRLLSGPNVSIISRWVGRPSV